MADRQRLSEIYQAMMGVLALPLTRFASEGVLRQQIFEIGCRCAPIITTKSKSKVSMPSAPSTARLSGPTSLVSVVLQSQEDSSQAAPTSPVSVVPTLPESHAEEADAPTITI